MSIQKSALEYVKSEGNNVDADALIEYIKNITKSYNSALVQITGFRHLLKDNGYTELADDLLKSPIYTDLLKQSRIEAESALEDGVENKELIDQAVMKRLGDYKTIYNTLIKIVDELQETQRLPNLHDLVYTLINFSARPTDIFNMTFKGDKLVNWGKQRNNKTSSEADYIGFLPLEDAKYLLHRIQLHFNKEPRDSLMKDLRNYTKNLLWCNPRDLRRISSIILSSTEPNRIKRIKKQQAILRHKNPITSILYYS
jgi:hypothetical protein